MDIHSSQDDLKKIQFRERPAVKSFSDLPSRIIAAQLREHFLTLSMDIEPKKAKRNQERTP
jgi:hypothetical protein